MTNDEWDTFALLLDKGFKWKEPFGDAHATAYRILLDGFEPQQIAHALRALIARGQVFGPTPGEIVALLRKDPAEPTFDEMFAAVYGLRGVLRARPQYTGAGSITPATLESAAMKRAEGMHPRILAFVGWYGLRRLRTLEVDHADYGDLKRKELRLSWEQFVEALDGREVHAIASGKRRGEMGRMNPLELMHGA